MIESVFMTAIRELPPSATMTRALMEVCDIFAPGVQPDESLRDINGKLIPPAAAMTVVQFLTKLIGPFHPAINTVKHDLRRVLSQ
jgi:hypothetical protein